MGQLRFSFNPPGSVVGDCFDNPGRYLCLLFLDAQVVVRFEQGPPMSFKRHPPFVTFVLQLPVDLHLAWLRAWPMPLPICLLKLSVHDPSHYSDSPVDMASVFVEIPGAADMYTWLGTEQLRLVLFPIAGEALAVAVTEA